MLLLSEAPIDNTMGKLKSIVGRSGGFECLLFSFLCGFRNSWVVCFQFYDFFSIRRIYNCYACRWAFIFVYCKYPTKFLKYSQCNVFFVVLLCYMKNNLTMFLCSIIFVRYYIIDKSAFSKNVRSNKLTLISDTLYHRCFCVLLRMMFTFLLYWRVLLCFRNSFTYCLKLLIFIIRFFLALPWKNRISETL